MKKFLLGLLILILTLPTTIFADDTYDCNPFDNSLETLPARYMGYDIKQLYEELKQKFPPKDEFETRDMYIKRLQSETYDNLFAFHIEENTVTINSQYNADKQKLEVKLRVTLALPLKTTSFRNLPVIVTRHIKGEPRKYIGSNAYGKQVEVTEFTGNEYGISPINKNGSTPFLNGIQYSIDISPEKAKELKTDLGVLILCKLGISKDTSSYNFESMLHAKPTINNPIELSYFQYFIFANIKEVWIYNFASGEVVQKFVLNK